jgi:hypothetical protein
MALILTLLSGFFAVSCEKKAALPDAPEGYNYRTLQVAWTHEGASRGTRELYLETSGYEDGYLTFARAALKTNLETDTFGGSRPVSRLDAWVYNIGGDQYTIYEDLRQVVKNSVEINPVVRMRRVILWREVMSAAIPRKDLTMEQRKAIQDKIMNVQDEDLIKIGVEISKDKMMGQSVKRYEIPLNEGHGTLWMYGDIPLKEELEFKRGGRMVTVKVIATKFVLNEDLPEEPFTSPKGYKLIDRSKPIPVQ